MSEPVTGAQLKLLKRLKYAGPTPKDKWQAMKLIDELLAAKKVARRDATDKGHREWLKERREEIRDQMKDDMATQREFERDMRRIAGGELDPRDRFAGWLIRIGPNCHSSMHLNGLLVLAADARRDPGLLPPYDDCREPSCQCEIEPVAAGEVPRGTRIAERIKNPQRQADDLENLAEVVSGKKRQMHGKGRQDRGSSDARAVTKGLKQKEFDDALLGIGGFLGLIAAFAAGWCLHWLAGIALFVVIAFLLGRWYYKE